MNCPQCHCYCPPDARECPCGHRFPAEEAPSPYARRKSAVTAFFHGAVGTRGRIWRLALLASLALWGLSLVFDDRLPPPGDILPQLYREPLQAAGDIPAPFPITRKKLDYVVTPLFRYELHGLVVSRHRSDSLLDVSHRRWRDRLNIMDLCVVWGRNIGSGVYRRMKFWNRDFTCMCEFPDETAARLFSGSHLSNNHILCADDALSRRILRVRPGDQVRFKGYLASYSQPANQFQRGSSTVRDDTGDGACETVFVTEFEVLRRANRGWRALKPLAFAASGVFFVLLLLA